MPVPVDELIADRGQWRYRCHSCGYTSARWAHAGALLACKIHRHRYIVNGCKCVQSKQQNGFDI